MKKKQIAVIIFAILTVGISLYFYMKPEPVIQSEQNRSVEDEAVFREAEKFASRVRKLVDRRSLQGLYRVSLRESEFFMAKSVSDLKAFQVEGWTLDELCHTEKEPNWYTCKVSNDAGQKAEMVLRSPNGKQWGFLYFRMKTQESRG